MPSPSSKTSARLSPDTRRRAPCRTINPRDSKANTKIRGAARPARIDFRRYIWRVVLSVTSESDLVPRMAEPIENRLTNFLRVGGEVWPGTMATPAGGPVNFRAGRAAVGSPVRAPTPAGG